MNKHHLISEELYKVLYLTKLLQNETISIFTFKECIKVYNKEIQKLKRIN